MKYIISWDTAEDQSGYRAQIWGVKENGEKILLKELNKNSTSTGSFDLDNTIPTSGE